MATLSNKLPFGFNCIVSPFVIKAEQFRQSTGNDIYWIGWQTLIIRMA